MSFFQKLKSGLGKTSSNISQGLALTFTGKKIDEETLQELEETLIAADIGARTAAEITSAIASEKFAKETTPEGIKEALANKIEAILSPAEKPLVINQEMKPYVIMAVGVNGNGKTTTLGKIAMKLKNEGSQVMLAACDTFRAAATSQLSVWAERAGCPLIKGEENSDPASVAFTALQKAKEENFDVLLIDTAGRLQNKQGLMEELKKISRVLKKIDEQAPHSVILVLDATTGQNAKIQVEEFLKAANINGIIITKLDGTAKAGVVVEIAKNYKIPINFIGVGEAVEDLDGFSAREFSRSLVGL